MEKFRQTCFLAFLCLFGSQISAQSKVAESPREVPLHRSGSHVSTHSGDTHRGGETLSDTFLKYNDGPELSILPLHSGRPWTMDRGPNLPSPVSGLPSLTIDHGKSDIRNPKSHISSNFSLVDQHLDPGAGEEIPILQPVPVTVFAHQILKDLETFPETSGIEGLGSCVLCLESSSSLVDDSTSPGQEGGIPSADGGALIYGQIRDHDLVGSVRLVFWDNYLEEGIKDPAPYSWTQEPGYGALFSGAPREQVFSFPIPEFSTPGYISLFVKDRPVLDKYLLMPGDSVKIRIDLMHGQVVFAGPSAPQFECRYLVDSRQMAAEFGKPMRLTVDNAEKELSKGDNRMQFEQANASFSRGLLLVERGEQELDILRSLADTPWEQSQAYGTLSLYEHLIPKHTFQVLRADLIGRHYSAFLAPFYKYVHSFGMAMDRPEFHKAMKVYYIEDVQEGHRLTVADSLAALSSGYLQYLFDLEMTRSRYSEVGYLKEVESRYRGTVRDKLLGKYLAMYYSLLPNGMQRVEQALTVVEEPYVKGFLETLKLRQSGGADMPDFNLTDMQGQQVSLGQLPPQTTLIEFWMTGCKACQAFIKNELPELVDSLRTSGDATVIMVAIDSEPEHWRRMASEYTGPGDPIINLTTEGLDHPILRYFNISSFPRMVLLDRNGKVFKAEGLPKTARGLLEWIGEANKIPIQTPPHL